MIKVRTADHQTYPSNSLTLNVEVQAALSITRIPPGVAVTHLVALAAGIQERGSAIRDREQTHGRRAVLGRDVRVGNAHGTASNDAGRGVAGAHVDVVLAAEGSEGFVGAGAGVDGLAHAAGVGSSGLARAGSDEGGLCGREDGGEEHLDVCVFLNCFVVIQGKKRTSLGSSMGNVSREDREVDGEFGSAVC